MRFLSLRLNAARFLVAVNFVWPFVNAAYFFPESTVEVNFLPVFLAVGLAPEILFEDLASLTLILATVGLAALWGSQDSALRLIVGTVPILFLISLHRRFLRSRQQLIPRFVAYSALAVFVGFSVLQYIDFNLFSFIPGWFKSAMAVAVPRYMDEPYDEFGTRGVQGWASEPSGAALTCFSFCVVAMRQDPQKRWGILLGFAILTAVNKSIYGIFLLALLGLGCLWHFRNKLYALLLAIPLGGAFAYFVRQSSRLAEVREGLLVLGLSQDTNRELARFAQMTYPLSAFPGMYKPVSIFGIDMQPLGLLPLLIGYGSVVGIIVYFRLAVLRLRFADRKSVPLALATTLVLSFLSPASFVPVIVAFVYALAPIERGVPLRGLGCAKQLTGKNSAST